jgi:hypothetical protein
MMRIRCSTITTVVLSGAMHLSLMAANCTNPVTAVPTTAWHTITPPREEVEVVYDAPVGWVGLNHIYAANQMLKHRRRSFIPWMMPQVFTVFPFSHALEAPLNRSPLFYVDHSDTAAHIADLSAHEVHLVRLRSSGKDRELAATTGGSVFSFDAGFSSRREIPLRVTGLSNTVFTIQPQQPLADGEYIIVFGPVADSGFEFGIHCLREDAPTMPQINAEAQKQK